MVARTPLAEEGPAHTCGAARVPGRDARRSPARPVPAAGRPARGSGRTLRGPRRRGGCRGIDVRRGRGARGQPGRLAAGMVVRLHRRGALRAAVPRRGHAARTCPSGWSAPTTGVRGRPTGAPSSTRSWTTCTGPTRCGATWSGRIRRPTCWCCRRTTGASSCQCARPGAGGGCSSTPRAGTAPRRGRSRPATRQRAPVTVGGRREGHEYSVESVPDGPEPFLAVTNHGGAREFTLSWVGLGADRPGGAGDRPIDAPLPGDREVADSGLDPQSSVPAAIPWPSTRSPALVVVSLRESGRARPVRGPGGRVGPGLVERATRCARPPGRPSSWAPTRSSTPRSSRSWCRAGSIRPSGRDHPFDPAGGAGRAPSGRRAQPRREQLRGDRSSGSPRATACRSRSRWSPIG